MDVILWKPSEKKVEIMCETINYCDRNYTTSTDNFYVKKTINNYGGNGNSSDKMDLKSINKYKSVHTHI